MKKIVSIVLLIAIVMTMSMANVYAADLTCKISVTPDKTQIKAGDTVNVKFTATDLNVGAQGLFMIAGKIQYDTKVFETITKDSITPGTGWTISGFESSSNQVALSRSDFINTENEVFTLKLVVKNAVTITTTEVGMTDINATAGAAADKVTIGNSNFVLTATTGSNAGSTTGNASSGSAPTIPTIPSVNTNSGNTTNTTNTTNSTNTTKNTATSSSNLPKSGVEDDFIIPAIVAIATMGIIAFIKYRKVK